MDSSSYLKFIKWAAVVLAVLVAGVFLLNFSGGGFVKELTQEVVLEKKESLSAVLGKPAPYFELNNAKVTDFLGAPLVVTFWATWNGASTDQIKILDDYLIKNRENLFKILAVSSQEDKSAVSSFIKRGGYQKIKILLDDRGKVTDAYKARSLPVSFFIDKEGVIKDIFIGVLSEKMLVEKAEKIIK